MFFDINIQKNLYKGVLSEHPSFTSIIRMFSRDDSLITFNGIVLI